MQAYPRNVGSFDPQERSNDSVLGTLAVPVVLVAIAAFVGWILLELIKGVIVAATYAVGIALVVVPLLLSPRLMRDRQGRERWRRLGAIVTAVLVGVALVVIAGLLRRHGWLLIVIPVALVAISRVFDRFAAHRQPAPADGPVVDI